MEFIYIAIIIAFSFFVMVWMYRTGKQQINDLKTENEKLKDENSRLKQKELEFVHSKALLEASLSTKEELLSLQQGEISNVREQFNKDFSYSQTEYWKKKHPNLLILIG